MKKIKMKLKIKIQQTQAQMEAPQISLQQDKILEI
jgi:hypothetical protein